MAVVQTGPYVASEVLEARLRVKQKGVPLVLDVGVSRLSSPISAHLQRTTGVIICDGHKQDCSHCSQNSYQRPDISRMTQPEKRTT